MAENEMEILTAAEGKEIEVAGTKVMVKPYNWITTAKMAKPLKTILQKYVSFVTAIPAESENLENSVLVSILDNLEDPDEFIDAVSSLILSAIDKDKNWLSRLMLDDLIIVGKAVYEVNRDFFVQRIAPMLPKTNENKKPAK